MELVGKDAVSVCLECLGDPDPHKAAPGTIRALYGTDPVRNCGDASATSEDAVFVSNQFIMALLYSYKLQPC